MIGFVLVTHTHIGHQMVLAIEQILKEQTGLIGVNFDPDLSIEKNQDRIREAVDQFKDREGVIILADIFGATPCNLGRNLCIPGKIEMVTGCNLPIVLKAATGNFSGDVTKTVEFLREYGKENIRISQGK